MWLRCSALAILLLRLRRNRRRGSRSRWATVVENPAVRKVVVEITFPSSGVVRFSGHVGRDLKALIADLRSLKPARKEPLH